MQLCPSSCIFLPQCQHKVNIIGILSGNLKGTETSKGFAKKLRIVRLFSRRRTLFCILQCIQQILTLVRELFKIASKKASFCKKKKKEKKIKVPVKRYGCQQWSLQPRVGPSKPFARPRQQSPIEIKKAKINIFLREIIELSFFILKD